MTSTDTQGPGTCTEAGGGGANRALKGAAVAMAVVVATQLAYLLSLRAPELVADAWAWTLQWVGPYLLVPLGISVCALVVSAGQLALRRGPAGPRPRLGPAGRLLFLERVLPTLGFLGTCLSISSAVGSLDSALFRGLASALGTTAIALTGVVGAQLALLWMSPRYRAGLREEAGEDEEQSERPDGGGPEPDPATGVAP